MRISVTSGCFIPCKKLPEDQYCEVHFYCSNNTKAQMGTSILLAEDLYVVSFSVVPWEKEDIKKNEA